MFRIWMGDVRPNMTEHHIMSSFKRCGVKPVYLKIHRLNNRRAFAFIHFRTNKEVSDTIHRLNGKPIPNTFPVVYFNLNNASLGTGPANVDLYLLWVGDLTPNVKDYNLFKGFASKYFSVKNAKVSIDAYGNSRGYGYVGFGVESQQKHALRTMNGYMGIGDRPIIVGDGSGNLVAAERAKHMLLTTPPPTAYETSENHHSNKTHHKPHTSGHDRLSRTEYKKDSYSKTKQDNEGLVDYKKPLDIDSMNREMKFLDMEWSLWDSMADSHFLPKDSYSSLYVSSYTEKQSSKKK